MLLGFVNPLAAQKTIKVACVGNSITYGAGIADQVKDSYPAVLGQMLGSAYQVRNYGYSGRTLLNKGDRPYMNEPQYRQALAFAPDIVIIKLGTNDTKPFNWQYEADFPKDLTAMVRSFQQLPSRPKIYLCFPVPAYRLDWGINDSIIKNGVIPYIREVAAQCGTDTIDLYTPFTNKPEWFSDQIHPTEEGAFQMAKHIYHVITGKVLSADFRLNPYPGVKSQWKGYERYDFNHKDRNAVLVLPHKAAEGNPWIWRPAFFGAYSSVDEALLEKGYHLAYFDLTDDFANETAMKDGKSFYVYLTKFCGLSPKVVLEGFSRGGMFAINWAARNTQKIAALYLDAPVCDVFSWPGKEAPEFQDFMNAWGLNESTVDAFKGNPLNQLETLNKAGIPIMLVCGGKDKTVPYKENGALLYKDYKKMGGKIELILKRKAGHHPHSLDDPKPIVDFILTNSLH